MDKSLIEKLKEVIEQHHQDTGERVKSFFVDWQFYIGKKADVHKVDINLEK